MLSKSQVILFVLIGLLTSCKQEEPVTILVADISNTEAEKLRVKGMGLEDELIVKEGKVSDTLEIKDEGVYSVSVARKRVDLYITPGENISIKADAKDFENTLDIMSAHGEVQTYLKEKGNFKKEHFGRSIYKLDQEAFVKEVNSGIDTLHTLIEKASLPPTLKTMELAELDYVKARLQVLYPIYARVDQDSLFVEELKNPLKGINMNDEKAFIQSSVYENMRSAHLNISISRDTSGTYEENFQKYIAALPSGNIKNTLLYNTMQFLMGPNEQKEEMYNFFNAHNTDEDYAQAMKEKYEELEVLNPGNPSPVFDYENHSGGKTKLDDLKGKYVYIDVWATWCGPCLREIPSLKKVEEEYHDKNIDFVSISIDDLEDHQKWVDMVNNKELGGVQLMADNAWQSDFVQDYKISGIPRFILLDPEGKIVSADAPRPSNEALIEKFNDLGI